MYMKNFGSLRGIGAALIVVAVFAGPALAAQPTVGDLYMELASLRGIAADSPIAAQTGLVSSGVDLPALDVSKTLTQGDVVDISRRFGLKLSTSRPNDEFSSEEMDGFVSGFGDEIGGRAAAEGYDPDKNGADPLTKGKGKKKGLWKQVVTPSEPV